MKDKAAIVIAALMITSIAFAFSTSVGANHDSATLSPTRARANTRVMFTVVVTNETSDNIDNVRIIAPSGSGFTQAIGYEENLKIAAENLENAVPYLQQAGENLILAEDNKKSAGPNIKAAGDNLHAIVPGDWLAENVTAGAGLADENTYAIVDAAAAKLGLVADAIDNTVENLVYVRTYLYDAGTDLIRAAANDSVPAENIENIKPAVADNIDNAGVDLQAAADYLAYGDLESAGSALYDVGENLHDAGTQFTDLDLRAYFETAGSQLMTAGDKLIDAGNFLDNAGYALGLAENYLTSAGDNLAGVTNLATAGNNLKIAASLIENAGIGIRDNVLAAGENLRLASDNLENVSLELGAALGGDEENAAAVHIDHAADNLRTAGSVGLTTAGNELKNAASDLSSAASVMLSTTNALGPTTWTISPGADYVNFNAIGDNVITPGDDETFVFLWTTPNVGNIENTYTITISSNKEGGGDANWITQDTITLTVDGKVPTLTIVVTQENVVDKDGNPVSNLVGTALDSARATITITASEPLQSIGTIYLENAGGTQENLLPPIENTLLTIVDENTYKYEFITVGEWDDNGIKVRVENAKDMVGLENTAGMENTVTVDTRAPIFIDNGLPGLIAAMEKTNVAQAGTDNVFAYVDNSASQRLIIRVEDNIASTDNDVYVISVTVDTTSATRSVVVENLWSLDPLTLDEGLNSVITVTATDRTGNTVSDNIENIFIDTRPPEIMFNTIIADTTVVTWDENGENIGDSTPEIKVTITDPGYETLSGLGVARENLIVKISDNALAALNPDNFFAHTATYLVTLDNKDAWDPSTGVFENLIDNAGEGLADGTYYIHIWASDNLLHGTENGKVASQSFTIDTKVPTWTSGALRVAMPFTYEPTGIGIPATTKLTAWHIEGTARKANSTVKIYYPDNTTLKHTIQAGSDNTFILDITMVEGKNQKVYIEEVDTAGNSSGRVLYGVYTVDKTPPEIKLSEPATGISTDAHQITVSGTVVDAKDPRTGEPIVPYDELFVTIDCTGAAVVKTVYLDSNGSFSTTVPLVEGTNVINVVAQDAETIDYTVGNRSPISSVTVTRTVTPWATYAIIIVIVALIIAAIAIFRKR